MLIPCGILFGWGGGGVRYLLALDLLLGMGKRGLKRIAYFKTYYHFSCIYSRSINYDEQYASFIFNP